MHASSMTRLRLLLGFPAEGNAVVPAEMVLGAPPVYVDFACRMRQAVEEILTMRWYVMVTDNMAQTLQRRTFTVDQMQVYWMIQGEPQYTFFVAGTNDDI